MQTLNYRSIADLRSACILQTIEVENAKVSNDTQPPYENACSAWISSSFLQLTDMFLQHLPGMHR